MCIESVFLYGLEAIKENFGMGLSFSDLLSISGLEFSYEKAAGVDRFNDKSLQVLKRKCQETQTISKASKKIQISFNEAKKLKNHSCQTISRINSKLDFHSNRPYEFEDFKTDSKSDLLDEFQYSTHIKEPQTCSIELAQSLLKQNPTPALSTKNSPKKGKIMKIDFGSKFLNKHF